LNIIEAIEDRTFLGALPVFQDLATWRPWLAFLRAVYGLPMDEADLALFARHTGRTAPRAGGYPEAVVCVGVQSGKSRIAATVAVFEAAQALARARDAERDDRGLTLPLVAQDARNAQRALFGYALEALDEIPELKREQTRETEDLRTLGGRVSVSVYPCRPAAIRGLRAPAVVIDELAFFTTTDGRPTDFEMLRAARGRVATTGGKILILSSPYAQFGALWDLHRRHYGRDDSSTLVWVAASADMNPTIPADYLARMAEEDPEAYRSEFLGEFRAGVTTLLDPDALAACVAEGERESPPDRGRDYFGFVDAASGSGKDAFTVAISHSTAQRAVLDVVRAWPPPFNPGGVIAEAAAVLKRYGLREATGDRYAPGFVSEGFRAHGITYKASELDRSAIYLELLPLVNARRALVLDVPELLRELRGLERRRGTSGRDRVDHRPGSHDDRANAAAGALVLAAEPAVEPARMYHALTGALISPAPRPHAAGFWEALRNGTPVPDPALAWAAESAARKER
jgi:hypothetical protein